MEKVLEIKNLSKSFGRKRVLYNISLDLFGGEILGYLGPNGSGKTTTIKLALGLLKMTHGEIFICGKSIQEDFEGALRRVGAIVENPELYPYLSARQNLRQIARVYDPPIGEERIDEVLSLVGLSEHGDERVSKFSLGMCQRLGIAQAILHSPSLLLLDEPTNGLDPAGIRDLRELLIRLSHDGGFGVLISSHNLSELELLCDRVAVLDGGSIARVATIAEMRTRSPEEAAEVRLEVDDAPRAAKILADRGISASAEGAFVRATLAENDIPDAISALVGEKIALFSVEKKKQTLEDAYLKITDGEEEEK